jgi:hypothetical protein
VPLIRSPREVRGRQSHGHDCGAKRCAEAARAVTQRQPQGPRRRADLQVLERLYAERHGGGEPEPDASAGANEIPLLGEAEPSEGSGEEHQHHEAAEQG